MVGRERRGHSGPRRAELLEHFCQYRCSFRAPSGQDEHIAAGEGEGDVGKKRRYCCES